MDALDENQGVGEEDVLVVDVVDGTFSPRAAPPAPSAAVPAATATPPAPSVAVPAVTTAPPAPTAVSTAPGAAPQASEWSRSEGAIACKQRAGFYITRT